MWNIENDSRKVGPGDEVDWLRSDLDESPVIAIKKKSLVNKLDDLARRKFGDDGQWRQVEAPCHLLSVQWREAPVCATQDIIDCHCEIKHLFLARTETYYTHRKHSGTQCQRRIPL